MVTIEEKMRLMKEIGMESAVSAIEQKARMLEEAKRLTEMKFRPTSEKEIRRKICGLYFIKETVTPERIIFPIIRICVAVLITALAALFTINKFRGPEWLWSAFFAGGIAGLIFSFFGLSEMEMKNLPDWTENIPYGALLAVKEARQAGLRDFTIYFPVTERRARVMADPVIVGYTHRDVYRNNPYEVFAWDDGKVYE